MGRNDDAPPGEVMHPIAAIVSLRPMAEAGLAAFLVRKAP
jgi:hypothetical protein